MAEESKRYSVPLTLIRKEVWEIEVEAKNPEAAKVIAEQAVKAMGPAEMKNYIELYAADQVPDGVLNVDMVADNNVTSWDLYDVRAVDLVNEYEELGDYDSSQVHDYARRLKEALERMIGPV